MQDVGIYFATLYLPVMTSRTATLNASNKVVWKMARKRGITNSTSTQTAQEKPPKTVLGLVTLAESEGRQTECQLYQRGRCHYGEHCKYVHVLRSESIRAPDIATSSLRYASNIASTSKSDTESGNSAVVTDSGQNEMVSNNENGSSYPVRNGAADCQYYLKTGKCNYGSRCKFNHPFRNESLVNALNRRDCFDFVQKGTCPYGKSCKYNHPSPQDELLRTLERQSASTSESSGSSPRSVSRTLPRRSASEPRYSSRKDLLEDSSGSRTKLSSNGPSHTRGRQMQPASKWSSSLDSPVAFIRKLPMEAQAQQEAHSPNPTQQPNSNYRYTENPWTNSSNRSTIATTLHPGLIAPSERVSEFVPRGLSHFVGQQALHHSVAPQATSEMIPPFMSSPELALDGRVLPRDQVASKAWYGEGQNEHASSGGAVISVNPVTTSLDRRDFPETNQPEMRLLRTSIWKNDFTVERKESAVNMANSSFEFGRRSEDRVASTSEPEFATLTQRVPLRRREMMQTTGWMSDHSIQMPDGYSSNPAVSMPPPRKSNTYAEEHYAPEFLRAEIAGPRAISNSWGVPGDTSGVDQSLQGMYSLHRQEQLKIQRQIFARHQAEQQAKLHRTERYSVPKDFRTASLKMQGYDEKKHEVIRHAPLIRRNYNSDVTLPSEGTSNDANRAWTNTDFDPLGYKGTACVHQSSNGFDSDHMGNVWKPAVKSNMFGPGLFGMQHHA